jgi:hypothetical protein
MFSGVAQMQNGLLLSQNDKHSLGVGYERRDVKDYQDAGVYMNSEW